KDASGQEMFQTFSLTIEAPASAAIAADPVPNSSSASEAKADVEPTPSPTVAPVQTDPTASDPTPTETKAAEKVVYKTPDKFVDVVQGGGGKYLVLAMPKIHKLGIFDVQLRKIAHYVSVDEEHPLIAAGAEKLIVVLPEKALIARYDLATGEREVMVPLAG